MADAAESRRCLVADDEPQIGRLLRDALARDGYAVDAVTDGEAASRRLGEQAYALAIFDVLMPLKTGVEILRELRARGDALPVVLMSSSLSDEVVAACAGLQRLAFLQKPFGLADLKAAVQKAVEPVRC